LVTRAVDGLAESCGQGFGSDGTVIAELVDSKRRVADVVGDERDRQCGLAGDRVVDRDSNVDGHTGDIRVRHLDVATRPSRAAASLRDTHRHQNSCQNQDPEHDPLPRSNSHAAPPLQYLDLPRPCHRDMHEAIQTMFVSIFSTLRYVITLTTSS